MNNKLASLREKFDAHTPEFILAGTAVALTALALITYKHKDDEDVTYFSVPTPFLEKMTETGSSLLYDNGDEGKFLLSPVYW